MHENLKFNLVPANKDVWQPIIAAQAYGTFFGVYIQFCDVQSSSTSDKHHCMFKIQNFRGPITLGLKGPVQINADLKPNPKDPIDFDIILGIEPFSLCSDIEVAELDFQKDFGNGMIVDVKYQLKDPPGFLYNKDDLNGSRYLNPYEYYRDGDNYLKVCFKDEALGTDSCDEAAGTKGGICDMTRSIILMP